MSKFEYQQKTQGRDHKRKVKGVRGLATGIILGGLLVMGGQQAYADELAQPAAAAGTEATAEAGSESLLVISDTVAAETAAPVATGPVTNATNLIDPQPEPTPEHTESLANEGVVVGESIDVPVETTALDKAVEEAKAAGVEVKEETEPTEYDNLNQAEADLSAQAEKVGGVTETKVEVDKVLAENNDKTKKAGVKQDPKPAATYIDNNKAALEDAHAQAGRVDVAVDVQVQADTQLAAQIAEGYSENVIFQGVTKTNQGFRVTTKQEFKDKAAALQFLQSELMKIETAGQSAQQIAGLINTAVSEAKKRNINVVLTNKQASLTGSDKASLESYLTYLKKQVNVATKLAETLDEFAKAQERADKLIADETVVAKSKGVDVAPGEFEEVTTLSDLANKSQAIADRLKAAGNAAGYVDKKEAETKALANSNDLVVSEQTVKPTADTNLAKSTADKDLATVKAAVATKTNANAELAEHAQKADVVTNLVVTKADTPITLTTGEVAKHVAGEKAELDQAVREALAEQARHNEAIAVQDKTNDNIKAKAQEVDGHDLITVVHTGAKTLALADIPAFEREQLKKLTDVLSQIEKNVAAADKVEATNAEIEKRNKELEALVAEYNTYAQSLIDSGVFKKGSSVAVSHGTAAGKISELRGKAATDKAAYESGKKNQADTEAANKALGDFVTKANAQLEPYGNNGKVIEVKSVAEAEKVLAELLGRNTATSSEIEKVHAENRAIFEAKGLKYTGVYATDKATADKWNAENAGERVEGSSTTGITTTQNTTVEVLKGAKETFASQNRHRYIFTEGDRPSMTIATATSPGGEVAFNIKNTSNGDVKLTFYNITPTAESLWTKDRVMGTVGIDVKGNGGIGVTVGVVAGGAVTNVGGSVEGGASTGGGGGIVSGAGTWLRSFDVKIETSQGVQYLTINDIDNGQVIYLNNPGVAQKTGGSVSRTPGDTYTGGGGNVVQGTTGVLGSHSVEFDFGAGTPVTTAMMMKNPDSVTDRFNIITGLFGPSSVREIKKNVEPIAIKKVAEFSPVERIKAVPGTVRVEQPTISLLTPTTEPPGKVPTPRPTTVEYATVKVDSKVKNYEVTYTPVNVSVRLNPVKVTAESGDVRLKAEIAVPQLVAEPVGVQMVVETNPIKLGTVVRPVEVSQKPKNIKDVKNSEGEDINGNLIPKGSYISWGTGGETLKAGRPQFSKITRTDYLRTGQTVDMEATRASHPDLEFVYDSVKHAVISTVASRVLAAANLDQTKPFILPVGRIYATVLNDNAKYENTFTTDFTYADSVIIDKDGKVTVEGKEKTYTVTSNKVGVETPSTPKPTKDVVDDKGNSINGQTVLPNSTMDYALKQNFKPYKGINATAEQVLKNFLKIEDYDEKSLDGKSMSVKSILAENGDPVDQLLNLHHVLSVDTLEDTLKDLVLSSGISPVGEFYMWTAKDPAAFYEAYVKKGLDVTYNLSFKINKDFKFGEIINSNYQIDFGNGYVGDTVKNDLPELKITKMVLNKDGKDIHTKEVALNEEISYKLDGWVVPAKRGYDLYEYRFVDKLQISHDEYQGYKVTLDVPFTYNGKDYEAGAEVDFSEVTHFSYDPRTGLFELNFNKDFLESISRDVAFGVDVELFVKRIAAGEVVNEYKLYVNQNEVVSNKVVTYTPEPPKPETPQPTPPAPGTPEPTQPTLPATGEATGIQAAVLGMGMLALAGLGIRKRNDF